MQASSSTVVPGPYLSSPSCPKQGSRSTRSPKLGREGRLHFCLRRWLARIRFPPEPTFPRPSRATRERHTYSSSRNGWFFQRVGISSSEGQVATNPIHFVLVFPWRRVVLSSPSRRCHYERYHFMHKHAETFQRNGCLSNPKRPPQMSRAGRVRPASRRRMSPSREMGRMADWRALGLTGEQPC